MRPSLRVLLLLRILGPGSLWLDAAVAQLLEREHPGGLLDPGDPLAPAVEVGRLILVPAEVFETAGEIEGPQAVAAVQRGEQRLDGLAVEAGIAGGVRQGLAELRCQG